MLPKKKFGMEEKYLSKQNRIIRFSKQWPLSALAEEVIVFAYQSEKGMAHRVCFP